jgi:PadR family transcriptional regulator PadR
MISSLDMRQDDMVREFFLGFIKVHILHHATEAPVYGLALITELRRHGYELSPGKLYPVLHELERAGYLWRLNRVVNGKVRKYYVLTRRGGAALRDARRKIGELVGELLEADIAGNGAAAPRLAARPRRSRRLPGRPADGSARRRSGARTSKDTPGASGMIRPGREAAAWRASARRIR